MTRQHRYRKKIAIWSILIIQMTGFFYDNIAEARSYPVRQVAKPECKADHRDKLSPECKINLPIVARANYAAYRENQLYRLIYSVLWGAPYSNGWDMSRGAHEGVDIVSSEGTPIYAVEDGVVFRARAAAGYGNLVTIKHTLQNGKVVYSIYGHLESYNVQEGQKVVEGQQIGTMGHEGMAWGNHLHFAINTTPDNTYVFSGCPDYPKFGDYEVGEKGLCRDNLFARTVDPIAFIEFDGVIPSAPTFTTSRVISRNIIRNNRRRLVPVAPMNESTRTIVATNTNIPITNTQSPVATNSSRSSFTSITNSNDNFLKNRKINVVSNFGTSIKKGGNSTIGISIESIDGKKFTGVLDKEISITPTKNIIGLSPRVIRYVSQGQVVSIIEAKETGTTDLVVSYGDTVIGKITVTVN